MIKKLSSNKQVLITTCLLLCFSIFILEISFRQFHFLHHLYFLPLLLSLSLSYSWRLGLCILCMSFNALTLFGPHCEVLDAESVSERFILSGIFLLLFVITQRYKKELEELFKKQEDTQNENLNLHKHIQQSQKVEAIALLASGIAHDFNNILASIAGYTNMSLDLFVKEEDVKLKKYLEQVLTSTEKAKSIIAQLQTFTRGGTQTGEVVNVNQVVEETVEMLDSILKGVKIDIFHHNRNSEIKMNLTYLQQVVMNLIINAKDAMNSKGYISIHIKEVSFGYQECTSCKQRFQGNFLRLSIKDEGSGIPSEIVDKLFQPYFTTKEVGKGTGMGLSLVHGMVHKSNGHITLKSRKEEGTTFNIFLPLEAKEPTDQKDKSNVANSSLPDAATKPSNKPMIVIIDEDMSVAQYSGDFLAYKNFNPQVFYVIDPALEFIEKNHQNINLVILDENLTSRSTHEISEILDRLNPAINIILLSNNHDNQTFELMDLPNVQTILEKPIDTHVLLEAVQSFSGV